MLQGKEEEVNSNTDDCLKASIQGLENYIKMSKERLVTVAS